MCMEDFKSFKFLIPSKKTKTNHLSLLLSLLFTVSGAVNVMFKFLSTK